MKKVILMLALFLAVSHTQSNAQVKVNINIGSQPVWGPAGYDYVDYYYLPDYDMYYNVPQRQWIYAERGRWVTANVLPGRYRNVDLYRTYKVVVNDRMPYRRAGYYRSHYAGFKGRQGQVVIRDSRDRKYYANNNGNRNNRGNDDKWNDDRNRNNDHNNGGHGNGHKGHRN